MPYSYYEDLSGDDRSNNDNSSCSCSDSSTFDNNNDLFLGAVPGSRGDEMDDDDDDDRVILHLDVDCFYCQCEALDRKLPMDRPLAIGQKHIIVTCNYIARQMPYGVSKLQSRQEALVKCPSLLIVEGSDLERYRSHARNIYCSFRRACQRLVAVDSRTTDDDAARVSVCKGSMDEMMADLSHVRGISHDREEINVTNNKGLVYVYGDQAEQTTLTEDQSGVSSIVVSNNKTSTQLGKPLQSAKSRAIEQRLDQAAEWGLQIRQTILRETGFTTTVGLSVNPLLAKLASGLRKPGTVNILYPNRSAELLRSMPLRKIPGVGHRTSKVLDPCLRAAWHSLHENDHSATAPPFWTCRDLLRVPRREIIRCLETVPAFQKNSRQQCTILLRQCHGQDRSAVLDDEGGLPKTVSVESSFRRGTLCTVAAVQDAMEDLYRRLPRLVQNRKAWSDAADKAYPTTLRLTVRSVDASQEGKAVTRSIQVPMDGDSTFRSTKDQFQKCAALRELVQPLLQSLVLSRAQNRSNVFNVTRINVAVTNFQDISKVHPPPPLVSANSSLKYFFGLGRRSTVPSAAKSAQRGTRSFTDYENGVDQSHTFKSLEPNKKEGAQEVNPLLRHGHVAVPRDLCWRTTTKKRSRIDEFFAPKSKR